MIMVDGHHESAAVITAMHCPELVRLTVHPRAGTATFYQLRSHTGRVLVSSTTHHDVIGCLAAMHQSQK
jgi:hypothetical protein